MTLKREIIRATFLEIKRTFTQSMEEAEVLDRKLKKENTKARDVPFKSFMYKKGMSLEYSMAMIYLLKENGIKSYLGVYKGEGLYTDEQKSDYAFVVYREGLRICVADFERIDPKWEIKDQSSIPIRKYRKIRGRLWIYSPYNEKKGNLPFFGEFLNRYNWKL